MLTECACAARTVLAMLAGMACVAPRGAFLKGDVIGHAAVACDHITKRLAEGTPQAALTTAVWSRAPRLALLDDAGHLLAQVAIFAPRRCAVAVLLTPWHASVGAQPAAFALAIRAMIRLHLAPTLARSEVVIVAIVGRTDALAFWALLALAKRAVRLVVAPRL